MTVWASFQKRLVEPVAPKVPSTLQEGFRASRLEGGFSNKEPSRDRWGHPLAKRNVLASLEEIGPDL